MHLHNVVVTSLTLLAAASASSGGWPNGQDDGADFKFHLTNFVAPPSGPTGGDGQRFDGNEKPTEKYEKRHLEVRKAEKDMQIKECTEAGGCDYQVVIPKGGKNIGDCKNRIDPLDGTRIIKPVDSQLMCTYFAYEDCKGKSRGPWTNQQAPYSSENANDGYFDFTNPQSYRCQLMSFGVGPAPCNPDFAKKAYDVHSYNSNDQVL